jgi:eukaryotic-like serine/threonine-protein kinase
MPMESHINRTVMVDVDAAVADDDAREQVVAGYTLQHRLGVGGYGEVWRGIGPGGLAKAVKILHGNFDGAAAESELKSLELMRELRHPFLLNIERIETDGSRLVIVSELAECSLEDRFEELRQSGQKGIPRDQLLNFLRDAADALDFMHQEHGLQHLDIKPGNLLIQGGHVKVADFGLIKDIRQTNVSMIGGFTPLYAPPELFEGEPSQSSDQYSLAIVYQLMLTGVPPFSGRTAAQLTAQHLSSKPDLSALTASDRSAVARALSKNPSARFPRAASSSTGSSNSET